MPEGPEVKIITQQLRAHLINKCVDSINIFGGRYKKELVPGLSLYLSANLPLVVEDISCKGKFIYFSLKDSKNQTFALWNTLGMSGSWQKDKFSKHDVAKITSNNENYVFSDVRHFGTLKFSSIIELQTKLSSLGSDLLSLTLQDKFIFQQALSFHPNKNITEVLMNQKIISGVGNYIKAESLYRSKISPHRIVSSLSEKEITDIFENILFVMQESFKHGGVSIKDFKDLNQISGRHQSFLQVYQKSYDINNNPIISETTTDKRTTWWCPNIQK